MDEDALKQINRLAFENGRMRFLIGEAITSMSHAETFIRSREKMHRTGIDLWCELVNRLQECLDDQNRPQNVDGPAEMCPKPAPGLVIDARGVLVQQDDHDETTPDDSPFCESGNEPYEEEAASGQCSACGKEFT